MEKPKDYYQLLGVPHDATTTAIERAFRRLARGFSRRPPIEEAGYGLAELQAAYETLSDAERRRRYDEQLRGTEQQPPARDGLLVRHRAAGDLRRPFTPASLVAEVVLGVSQAARGTVLPIDVPVSASCEACQGTGGRLLDCAACLGEGKVIRRLPVPVHVPRGTADGAVFEVRTGDPAFPTVLLTIHLSSAT